MMQRVALRKLNLLKQSINNQCFALVRHGSSASQNSGDSLILGIETSCDDTGAAIIDGNGSILGEALRSQHLIHLRNGGIIPPVAHNLHRENIEEVVNEALSQANLSVDDLSAIACTVEPGLPLSLLVGTKYTKYLCRKYKKPMIPIHHMEAHALTARLHDGSLKFPFLVLLISGGHCLLSFVKGVKEFLLLGQSMDDAPGEAFDKMARRLKLKNIEEFSKLNGGQSVELAASKADDPLCYQFTIPLSKYKDCNFSMAGLKNQFLRQLLKEEKEHDIPPDGVVPAAFNLCAALQLTVTRHLCHRVQRAMEFVELKGFWADNDNHHVKTLVVSGGVACNDFIAKGLQIVCDNYDYKLIRPPPKLCTDNGVMIAWNGVEKWKSNVDILSIEDLDKVQVKNISPLGVSLIKEVADEQIRCNWIKLSSLHRK